MTETLDRRLYPLTAWLPLPPSRSRVVVRLAGPVHDSSALLAAVLQRFDATTGVEVAVVLPGVSAPVQADVDALSALLSEVCGEPALLPDIELVGSDEDLGPDVIAEISAPGTPAGDAAAVVKMLMTFPR